MPSVRWLGDEACHESVAVGGKVANLSRLSGIHQIPPGFVIPAHATVASGGPGLAENVADEVVRAYRRLAAHAGGDGLAVAVRSSGIDEDGAGASFAGQHETYLNVRGADAVVRAIHRCIASASAERAQAYRTRQGLGQHAGIAVLVQTLVLSDVSAVVFSANPISGARDEIMINASWGLGESVVGGTVTPDMFVVRKPDFAAISTSIATKTCMTVLVAEGTGEVEVPREMRDTPSLRPDQVAAMAKLAVRVEERMGWHADIECAIAGEQLYLLQCRPITTLRD